MRAGGPEAHQAAPAPGVGGGLRERGPRPGADRRRGARVAVRRQLRLLPQPDQRRQRRRRSGGGCRSSSTSRSRSVPGANAQQIFESLNSTGEPLRDHELIHNYVLMGLSHAEQSEIEQSFWVPIEQNTGDAIEQLLAALPRDDARGARWRSRVSGACTTRSARVPAARARDLRVSGHGMEGVLGHLPRPAGAGARSRMPTARAQLALLNTFGGAMYPLVMRVYRDHLRGAIDAAEFRETARAAAVAAAAPDRRRHAHRPPRRAAVPRARTRSRGIPARDRTHHALGRTHAGRAEVRRSPPRRATCSVASRASIPAPRSTSSTSSRCRPGDSLERRRRARMERVQRGRAEQPPRARADTRQPHPAGGAARRARAGSPLPREARGLSRRARSR